MSKIQLQVQGDLIADLNRYVDEVEEDVSQAVTATALGIQAKAIKRIQRGTKSGRIYQKYNPRRTHQASAPGQSPATDTGRLVGSIQADKQTRFRWTVGTIVPYGRYLEFGTRRIAERPWLRPSVQEFKPAFIKRIRQALRRVQG